MIVPFDWKSIAVKKKPSVVVIDGPIYFAIHFRELQDSHHVRR